MKRSSKIPPNYMVHLENMSNTCFPYAPLMTFPPLGGLPQNHPTKTTQFHILIPTKVIKAVPSTTIGTNSFSIVDDDIHKSLAPFLPVNPQHPIFAD